MSPGAPDAQLQFLFSPEEAREPEHTDSVETVTKKLRKSTEKRGIAPKKGAISPKKRTKKDTSKAKKDTLELLDDTSTGGDAVASKQVKRPRAGSPRHGGDEGGETMVKPPARKRGLKTGSETAESMASRQREISVSEFFAKNRHLLGFDNPRKALLTTVKEAVDNSLDACEEAGILPEIEVGIVQVGEDRFRVWVQDNGPGIVKSQIPNIFGRLLYGSKFHTLRMARGQQGIGISAAGMYGLLTTGKAVKIISRTSAKSPAHYYELQIDTQKNRPEINKDEEQEWDTPRGTRVEIEMEARYQRGKQSVDEYLAQTAITNPHARIRYMPPGTDEPIVYERMIDEAVAVPEAVKPHPYGVEIGFLLKMSKMTSAKTMTAFLTDEFSRVSLGVSQELLKRAKIGARKRPSTLDHQEAERLYRSIQETKIMSPATSSVVPIGSEALLKGLQQVVAADFYAVASRPPSVYRGNPFVVEAALAYGGGGGDSNESDEEEELAPGQRSAGDQGQQQMRVLRFANRVPLLYQQSGCAVFKSIVQTNWRLYGMSQSRGALPQGPVTVILHIASVWVPFTSESKEAVAHYPEIIKEMRLALAEVGRKLGRYLKGERRRKDEAKKRSYIEKYLPAIGEALKEILTLNDKQVATVVDKLEFVLEHSRGGALEVKDEKVREE